MLILFYLIAFFVGIQLGKVIIITKNNRMSKKLDILKDKTNDVHRSLKDLEDTIHGLSELKNKYGEFLQSLDLEDTIHGLSELKNEYGEFLQSLDMSDDELSKELSKHSIFNTSNEIYKLEKINHLDAYDLDFIFNIMLKFVSCIMNYSDFLKEYKTGNENKYYLTADNIMINFKDSAENFYITFKLGFSLYSDNIKDIYDFLEDAPIGLLNIYIKDMMCRTVLSFNIDINDFRVTDFFKRRFIDPIKELDRLTDFSKYNDELFNRYTLTIPDNGYLEISGFNFSKHVKIKEEEK